MLSNLDAAVAKPLMSSVLLALGLYVFLRFTFRGLPTLKLGTRHSGGFLSGLGLFAGFIDATGGGGWGPVGTPALLAAGRLEPRKVIGSIDTSEFLVSVAASAGFLLALGSAGIDTAWVVALLVGGLIAAPIAAWLVRHIPPRVLGSAVGGVIVLTNSRTLLRSDWIDASDSTRTLVYLVLAAVWAGAVAWSVRAYRGELALERELADLEAELATDDARKGAAEPA